MRLGETPVPIPNTMVKTEAADDTMLETAWESRWLPDYKKKNHGFISDSSIKDFCVWMADKTAGCEKGRFDARNLQNRVLSVMALYANTFKNIKIS